MRPNKEDVCGSPSQSGIRKGHTSPGKKNFGHTHQQQTLDHKNEMSIFGRKYKN